MDWIDELEFLVSSLLISERLRKHTRTLIFADLAL